MWNTLSSAGVSAANKIDKFCVYIRKFIFKFEKKFSEQYNFKSFLQGNPENQGLDMNPGGLSPESGVLKTSNQVNLKI